MSKGSYLKFCLLVVFLAIISVLLFPYKNSEEDDHYFREYESESAPDAPFLMPSVTAPNFPERICDIKKYGAREDGKTLNTEAFKKAIEDCSQEGGGYVIVPDGQWLTGAIHLKSDINLHLEEGAEIIFSSDLNDYLPVVFTRFQGIELFNFSPLIYAKDCENIAITGKGTLNGQGEFWQKWSKLKTSDSEKKRLFKISEKEIPVEERIFGKTEGGVRPSFIQTVNCQNVFLENIHIINSPMWTVHPVYSENIIIQKVSIETFGPNTDGIVIDSSKNVFIDGAIISSGDDAIAIKSGLDKDGWRVNRPSENIVVKNCQITGGHSGISIGSEVSGGIKNFLAENLEFSGTDNGFRIKSAPVRGGFVENIFIKNIKMKNIIDDAIVFDFLYNSKFASDNMNPTAIQNINIQDITGENIGRAVIIEGLVGSAMERIDFRNFDLVSKDGVRIKQAKNINFSDINIQTEKKPVFKLTDTQNIQLPD